MTHNGLFGVGIIGCGLIGQKRLKALGKNARLVACADLNVERAQKLAQGTGAKVFSDWQALLLLPEVDIVIVATLHDSLATITLAAVEQKKHVFVEKPAARSYMELEPIIKAIEQTTIKVRVGFNHRYHRALRKAKTMIENQMLGELMFIRAVYGHGARIDYDKEWRANPLLSGGGELIDQGPHLIDLSRWFLGEFVSVSGFAHTYYWSMPVDDNGFMILKTACNKTAFLHVSCTEWKNTFSMEIYGKTGKLHITGLGGSYGIERLTYYKMLPEMGPPETTIWEYPMEDDSWSQELEAFYEDIRLNRLSKPGLKDAYESLKVIQKIYKECGYDHYT